MILHTSSFILSRSFLYQVLDTFLKNLMKLEDFRIDLLLSHLLLQERSVMASKKQIKYPPEQVCIEINMVLKLNSDENAYFC